MAAEIPRQNLTVWNVSFQAMNAALFHARQMSLALLVMAVVEHGHLNAPDAGAGSSSSALLRLGRDFIRRTSGIPAAAMLEHIDHSQCAAAPTSRPGMGRRG
jgi:hypothetical protein